MNIKFVWKSYHFDFGEELHATAEEMIQAMDFNNIGYLVILSENDQIELSVDIDKMNIDSPPQGINIDDQIWELETAIEQR